MANSTSRCPLWQRSDGRWCKKIKGRVHYFGTDKAAALAEWERVGEDLMAGREPRDTIGMSVAEICNEFLNAKQQAVTHGELSEATFRGYFRACKQMIQCLGRECPVPSLTPMDFARFRTYLVEGRAASTARLQIKLVRTVLKWAIESELIERPPRYGQNFKPPSELVIERQREATGERLFTREQIWWMIDNASDNLRPMLWLGINAAFGPTDVALLEFKHLDLDNGWINKPRSKTAMRRRCRLWSETVDELQAAILTRPKPSDGRLRHRVFVTPTGRSWEQHKSYSPIVTQTQNLLRSGDRWEPRNTFYTLRRTFRTVADEIRDDPAIDLIMGHQTPGMGSVYRQRIADDRLRAVADYVHGWLFPPDGEAEGG